MRLALFLLFAMLATLIACTSQQTEGDVEIYARGVLAIEKLSVHDVMIQGRNDLLICSTRLSLAGISEVIEGLPGNVNLPGQWVRVKEDKDFTNKEKDLLSDRLGINFSKAKILSREDLRQLSRAGERLVYFSPLYKSKSSDSYLFYVGVSTTQFFLVHLDTRSGEYTLVHDGVM